MATQKNQYSGRAPQRRPCASRKNTKTSCWTKRWKNRVRPAIRCRWILAQRKSKTRPPSRRQDRPRPISRSKATPDQTVSLDQLKGKPIVLVFYPADWSPVCGDQVSLYNEMLSEFQEYDAQIVGISVDGPWCHMAFAKDRKLRFPLLADFEPKGEVSKLYGIYDTKTGTCERALFVIDAGGVVRWKYVSPVGINPGAEGILDALDKFAKKERT